jgi:tetratricopeptide (TPR) repeat protein
MNAWPGLAWYDGSGLMRALRSTALLLVALVAAVQGLAAAQVRDSKAFAREHVESGREHFKAREYDEAIDDWKQAYLLDPAVDTLFSIAEAQRLKGDCKEALDTYKTVLREEPPAEMVKHTKRGMGLCDEKLSRPTPKPAPAPAPAAMAAPSAPRAADPPGTATGSGTRWRSSA